MRAPDVFARLADRPGLALLAASLGFTAIGLVVFAPFLFGPTDYIASKAIGDAARFFVYQRGFYAEQMLSGNRTCSVYPVLIEA